MVKQAIIDMKKIKSISTLGLFLVAILLCNYDISKAEKPRNINEFPFQLIEGNILMECTVNDTINGAFGFDTGGGIHIVSQPFLEKLNAEYVNKFTGIQAHGAAVTVDMYKIASINMGDAIEKDALVAPFPGLENYGIDGILSLKLFQDHPFTIDFKNSKIIIENDASISEKIKTGNTVPLKLQIYRDYAIDFFGDFLIYNENGDSMLVELEIDTGRGYETKLNTRYMDFFGLTKEDEAVKKIPAHYIRSTKEEAMYYICNISKIALEDARSAIHNNPKVIFEDDLIYDGLIGISIWKDKLVTFDIPNKRLIVN